MDGSGTLLKLDEIWNIENTPKLACGCEGLEDSLEHGTERNPNPYVYKFS